MAASMVISVCIVALVFSVISLVFALANFISHEAMKRSTHRVQIFDPSSQSFSSPVSLQDAEKMKEDVFDNIQ